MVSDIPKCLICIHYLAAFDEIVDLQSILLKTTMQLVFIKEGKLFLRVIHLISLD